MINLKNVKTFVETSGVKSILQTKPQYIHGINPTVTYPLSGKVCYLPRFCSVEMKEAGAMNKIAQNRLYENTSNIISGKGSIEDIQRLTSETAEDSYKRAIWVNPKDNKPYYILEESRDPDGKINVRILDKNVQFVKNAKLKPKEVILTDMDKGLKKITEIDGLPLNHTDMIELLAKRYNPFANYKIMHFANDDEFINLKNHLGNDKPIVSASYGAFFIPENKIQPGQKTKGIVDYINKERINDLEKLKNIKEVSKKARILASSGNDGKDYIARLLIDTGIEGVGGLNYAGKVDINSSSVNSLFTQHYEPYSYNVTKTDYGLNFSRLKGTDIEWDSDTPTGKLLHRINGTSFSTPVRAAKLALNEMMEGIL